MRILLLLRGSAGCGKSTWIERNGLKDKILINNYDKPLNVSHTLLSKVQPKYFL